VQVINCIEEVLESVVMQVHLFQEGRWLQREREELPCAIEPTS